MKKNILILFFLLFTVGLSAPSYGEFIGPYSGRVVDANGNSPVPGASVFIYLTKLVPESAFGGRSEIIQAALLYTGEDGTYSLPGFEANFGLKGRFESVNIIVYEPGYEAHILKIEFLNSYNKPDPAFKKDSYLVKLKRLPPVFDHKEHIRKIEDAMSKYQMWNMDIGMADKKLAERSMERFIKDGYLDSEEFLRRMEWEEKRRMDKEYPR
jgi:hypothetical protein